MPVGGRLCYKCRSGLPSDGDTWCKLCSSAGALSEAAKHRFQSLAFRALAEEVVCQCSRQVLALVQLDRQVHSERTSLTDRLANTRAKLDEVTCQVDRSAAPKSAGGRPQPARASSPPPEPASVKSEPASGAAGDDKAEAADFGSESEYEESDEEEEIEEDKAPAEPKAPAEVKPKSPELDRGARRPRSPSRPPLERTRKKRKRSRSRKRGRRGGSRHQAQYRALQDPNLQFHRSSRPDPIDLGGGRRRRKPDSGWR